MIAAPNLAQQNLPAFNAPPRIGRHARRVTASDQSVERARIFEEPAPSSIDSLRAPAREARVHARSGGVFGGPSPARPRTAARLGLSPAERARLKGALRAVRNTELPTYHFTIGDALHELGPDDHAKAREVIADFLARLVRDQGRAGLPQFYALALECRVSGSKDGPRLHGHVVAPATEEMVAVYRSSEAFAPYMRDQDAIVPVYDFARLARYLSKETEALPGGGDRVILSRRLKAAAVVAGLVEPYQRTTTRHASARSAETARLARAARSPDPATRQPVVGRKAAPPRQRADRTAKAILRPEGPITSKAIELVRKAREARPASTRPEPARLPEPPPLAAPAAPEAHLDRELDPTREPAGRIVLSANSQVGATVISR
ncbi:hypothetical protein [Methylobacterium radiotolerans]|uniref:hypothetical protein n=1 Tax=Methylobacterium radiotolerans TaxID=31998 RepID=UPI0015F6F543|nr:hypothetical protein [Methylobacterium radiotolerans]